MGRIIDPYKYVSWEQMMLEVCKGCGHENVRAYVWELHKLDGCHECYSDMERKYEEGKPFEVDW